jgi:hypothetical protein
MSLIQPMGTGKWPVDSVDEELCKVAADFFVSLMPPQDQLNSDNLGDSYRGPGIWATARYMAIWFMDDQKTELTSIELATQLVSYWLNIEASSEGWTTYVSPILDDCSASVCRAIGWEGNNDLAGIGVGIPDSRRGRCWR